MGGVNLNTKTRLLLIKKRFSYCRKTLRRSRMISLPLSKMPRASRHCTLPWTKTCTNTPASNATRMAWWLKSSREPTTALALPHHQNSTSGKNAIASMECTTRSTLIIHKRKRKRRERRRKRRSRRRKWRRKRRRRNRRRRIRRKRRKRTRRRRSRRRRRRKRTTRIQRHTKATRLRRTEPSSWRLLLLLYSPS